MRGLNNGSKKQGSWSELKLAVDLSEDGHIYCLKKDSPFRLILL